MNGGDADFVQESGRVNLPLYWGPEMQTRPTENRNNFRFLLVAFLTRNVVKKATRRNLKFVAKNLACTMLRSWYKRPKLFTEYGI